jgi:hypothetical protein
MLAAVFRLPDDRAAGGAASRRYTPSAAATCCVLAIALLAVTIALGYASQLLTRTSFMADRCARIAVPRARHFPPGAVFTLRQSPRCVD